jgi:hypothetical protein
MAGPIGRDRAYWAASPRCSARIRRPSALPFPIGIVRTAVETYTRFIEPRMAAEPTASGKVRACLAASADFMVAHRSVNLAIVEIAFNAIGPDGHEISA